MKHMIKIYSSPCQLVDRVSQLFILEIQFQSVYWQERIRVSAKSIHPGPCFSEPLHASPATLVPVEGLSLKPDAGTGLYGALPMPAPCDVPHGGCGHIPW